MTQEEAEKIARELTFTPTWPAMPTVASAILSAHSRGFKEGLEAAAQEVEEFKLIEDWEIAQVGLTDNIRALIPASAASKETE